MKYILSIAIFSLSRAYNEVQDTLLLKLYKKDIAMTPFRQI